MLISGLILVILAVNSCLSLDAPTVSIGPGKIVGYYKTSYLGKEYQAYEGVPYALSPTGERRFEPPNPTYSYTGEIEAKKKGTSCLQHAPVPFPSGSFYAGSEDCLFLNVYVPNTINGNSSLPVIIWIYGGAFQYGAPEEDAERFLIDHDVIFVDFSYRLNIFGFLSTEDDVVPGNMGLKDQSVALRWVHKNIKYFGGDPNRVMLTGLSAGGTSVNLHYLSPMSSGLFRSGISFSGTALDPWSQTQHSREKALKLGALLDCPTHNVTLMVDCLKRTPAERIIEKHGDFMAWASNPFTPFGPVVEKSSKNAFISRSPIDIISRGDVYDAPWITGVVSEEGLYPVAEYATNETALQELNEYWELIAPHLLDYNYTLPKNQHELAAKKARQHYLGDKPINKENLIYLTHMVGDRLFYVDAEKAAREMAKVNKNPVYFYKYNYRATDSYSNVESKSTENFGVSHGDDALLVIGNQFMTPTKTPKDMAMHDDLLKFWLSVLHKDVPDFGPKWIPVNPWKGALDFLQMNGPGNFSMGKNTNFGEKMFWNSLGFNENRKTKVYRLKTRH